MPTHKVVVRPRLKYSVAALILAALFALALHGTAMADEPDGSVTLPFAEDAPIPLVDPANNILYTLEEDMVVVVRTTPSASGLALPYDTYNGLAFDTENQRLYAGCSEGCPTCSDRMTVTVVNTPWHVGLSYDFAKDPQDEIADMALSGDGQHLYVALAGESGDVVVIDAMEGTEIRRMGPSGSGNDGEEVVVDPVSGYVFYHYSQSDTHYLRVWTDYGGTVTTREITATNAYDARILLDEDDRRVYAGNLVLDANNGNVLSNAIPIAPQAINPHTNELYAIDHYTSILYAIDGETYEITAIATYNGSVSVGVSPQTHKLYVGVADNLGTDHHLYILDPETYNSSSKVNIKSFEHWA